MSEGKTGSLKRLFVDALRYGVISVVALVVDFGTLLILNSVFHINYLAAAAIGFILGLIVNYLLSHERLFTDPVIKSKSINFVAFSIIGVVGLIGNDAIMWVWHDKVGMSVFWSKCVAVVIVFFWNFLARRQFLYQGHRGRAR